jgi:hypothetical protein
MKAAMPGEIWTARPPLQPNHPKSDNPFATKRTRFAPTDWGAAAGGPPRTLRDTRATCRSSCATWRFSSAISRRWLAVAFFARSAFDEAARMPDYWITSY